MPENERLLPLAGAVADGRSVDWPLAEAAAEGDEERALIQHLKLVASVADLHRSMARPPASLADDGPTLAGPPSRERSPDAPETWGPLSLIERVGRGASADVWRAWDTRLDRQVALKLYVGRGSDAAVAIDEARLLARVRHPNVVTVHGAERIQGQAGLWMEFIEGRTLSDLVVRQGPLGAREAALIGLDLCRALAALHRSDLVHGDVKANNVMREEGGRIVLMDLSAAKEALNHGQGACLSGTPLYMAPELLRGVAPTSRSDIYSLGVLLFYLVTGSFPVGARTLAELAQAHERGERRLLRDVRPDLPAPFIRLVERATAPDPGERFESAGQMEAELARGSDLGFPDLSSRPRRLLIGLAASLILAAGVAVVSRLPLLPSRADEQPRSTGNDRGTAPPLAAAPAKLASPERAPAPRAAQDIDKPSAAANNTRQPSVMGEPGPPTGLPYSVQAAFYRHETGADIALAPGAHVAPGDRLSMEFQASTDLHLYVVNEDEEGSAFLLFPLAGQEPANPLPGGALHRLPGRRSGQSVYWQVTSQGGRERFLLVASPDRRPEVEAEVAALEQPRFGQMIAAPLASGAYDRMRGLGGLATVERAASGGPGRLARLAERLASQPERVRGTWVRQFELEN